MYILLEKIKIHVCHIHLTLNKDAVKGDRNIQTGNMCFFLFVCFVFPFSNSMLFFRSAVKKLFQNRYLKLPPKTTFFLLKKAKVYRFKGRYKINPELFVKRLGLF